MRSALFVLLLFVSAHPAFGQFDMDSMLLMRTKPAIALTRADLKKELKLTKDQDASIGKIEKDLQAQMGGNNQTSINSAMAFPGKIDEASAQIVAILDETQRKRLF